MFKHGKYGKTCHLSDFDHVMVVGARWCWSPEFHVQESLHRKKHQNIYWAAILRSEKPCWLERWEEDGQTSSSWQEGSNQLLGFWFWIFPLHNPYDFGVFHSLRTAGKHDPLGLEAWLMLQMWFGLLAGSGIHFSFTTHTPDWLNYIFPGFLWIPFPQLSA